MEEVKVKVSASGRVLIPARFRRALGLADGDELLLSREGDRLVLTSRTAALRRAQALAAQYRGADESEVDALLAARRAEAARE